MMNGKRKEVEGRGKIVCIFGMCKIVFTKQCKQIMQLRNLNIRYHVH
jgi:hypothetical protein